MEDEMSSTSQVTSRDELDQLAINTIRMLAVDAVQKANSGHPGLPMDSAAMAYVLWTKFMRFNPRNPTWPNRDRFILSAGHGSMLLYALLHLTGYDLSLDEIKNFRQWESKTPGHPEFGHTPGVETSTGPLGQGFGNAVGMAIGEAYLAARFNKPGHEILDYNIYVIASDGDMMEGVASEAASLAGHLKLGKLVVLYSDNRISIEGSTELAFTEDVGTRFLAYDWHVQRVEGNNLKEVEAAIRKAKAETTRPSLIVARTHIGYGSPNKQDTAKAHGEPLGAEEVKLTKENLGWPAEPPFYIPEAALEHFRTAVDRGQQLESEWRAAFDAYAAAHPEDADFLRRGWDGELPEGWDRDIPTFTVDQAQATRAASGAVINAIAPRLPLLIGGSADLAPSTNTLIKGEADFQAGSYAGRNLHWGVREHAMGSALNGMALTQGLIPYGATFLVFSDYMRPTIRLAALMRIHTIYVFTHDSVGLGEDGPTHQPIEHLSSLRAIPNLTVIRPADPNETAEAWRVAITRREGPVALVLTRQKVPVIDRTNAGAAEGLARGAYVLKDAPDGRKPEAILIGTGSEVQIALQAYERLVGEGIAARAVSMPSWSLFEEQPASYRDEVLPPDVTARVSIEAGSELGWDRYVGLKGAIIGLARFGASAPYETIYKHLGFTPEGMAEKAKELLGK
jgi:transketolase